MLYVFIASLIASAALIAFVVRCWRADISRLEARQDAREDAHREHVKRLEDQIILLKVEPQVAVASAVDSFAPPRQFTLYDNDEDLEKSLKELE